MFGKAISRFNSKPLFNDGDPVSSQLILLFTDVRFKNSSNNS